MFGVRSPDLHGLRDLCSGRPPLPGSCGASSSQQAATRAVRSVQRPLARRGIVIRGAIVTRALVALNVIIYLITVAQGGGINDPGGPLFNKWLLYGPFVAHGDWWRLLTACFLHVGIWHIAVNMYALWWLGSVVEGAIGSLRFSLLYIGSGLAGSAGALLWNPNAPTVGASGAIFGMLGAGLLLEWRATGRLMGGFAVMILINLAFTFGFSSFISVGGHVGGPRRRPRRDGDHPRAPRAAADRCRHDRGAGRGGCRVDRGRVLTRARDGLTRRVQARVHPPATAASTPDSTSAACAAARRASGTRYGEHDT